ncbi:hypothetical protein ERD78_18940 [Allopusillimonas soli]|uniref:Holin n=1 Tax=Allopusillimonas soli TaxID=659016 RepID=A0A853FDB7_9BURK|nr:hypothetical protein [Allopusillimonas soli]NYT38854.1 hypothetical protein [Allopusillimonas soli]TEA70146.1 hypothetical protein ERD78_18940 [Allopusillimonas soli]
MFYWMHFAANLILAAASAWAVVSPRVKDGWFGKFSLMLLSLAALANAGWAWLYPAALPRSEVLLNVAVACMAVRCYWLKSHAHRVHRWKRSRKCRE